MRSDLSANVGLRVQPMLLFFVNFFGGVECVGHSIAYVAHFVFMRDEGVKSVVEVTVNSKKENFHEQFFRCFLHKSVWYRSLTLPFQPFIFWLRIRGDIRNRVGESTTLPRVTISFKPFNN
jgi:hypothetical protein